MLGLTHAAVSYLVEQLPGAREAAETYKFKHHEQGEAEEALKENPSGSARAEKYRDRKPLDMFSWLASRHRLEINLIIHFSFKKVAKIQSVISFLSFSQNRKHI